MDGIGFSLKPPGWLRDVVAATYQRHRPADPGESLELLRRFVTTNDPNELQSIRHQFMQMTGVGTARQGVPLSFTTSGPIYDPLDSIIDPRFDTAYTHGSLACEPPRPLRDVDRQTAETFASLLTD